MATLIPAEPGTYLIGPDCVTTAVIIAWQYIQGNDCLPVFSHARSGVLRQEAFLFPSGVVSHPASKMIFEDHRAWEAHASEFNLAESTEEIKEPVASTKPAAAKPAATKPEPSHPAGIIFGTKTQKTKSFWHWPDANAVFEIEGETALPNDPRAVKVKREEFFALKRDGAAKVDPHAGTIHEDDEPEAAPVDADDDDMSVI